MRKGEAVKKKRLKELYESAELEVVLFDGADVVTLSIEETEDEIIETPGTGNWDEKGWETW